MKFARWCAGAVLSGSAFLSCLALPTWLVVGGGAAVLVGCQDDNLPEYWVRKLGDGAWRARAVRRLEQFFEDAATRAGPSADSPELKALLDKIVAPLAGVYAQHRSELDDKTRLRLIRLLGSFRDARAEPALVKALQSLRTTGGGAQEARWAARAAAELKLPGAQGPMLAAFTSLQVSTKEGRAVAPHFNEAMRKMASPSWVAPLTQALIPVMALPQPTDSDPKRLNDYQNQLFWQTTAVQILGEIRDPAGVEPLLKVLLDPGKGGVQRPALLALVKIGGPAVRASSDLLLGKSPELESFAQLRTTEAGQSAEADSQPHVRAAAIVLGAVGSGDCRAPLLSALEAQRGAARGARANRAILARELTNVPASPESLLAFRKTFESLSPDDTVPPGTPVRPMMAEAAARFFEPSLVPWLLRQSGRAKREAGTRTALLLTAIKLVGPEQLQAVSKAIEGYGGSASKRALEAIRPLLQDCEQRRSCYLESLFQRAGPGAPIARVKSAYMLGVVGDTKTRDEIVRKFGEIASPALRFVAASAIDHLSPTRSAATADALQALIDKNALGGDPQKALADAPVQHVVYRLRSR